MKEKKKEKTSSQAVCYTNNSLFIARVYTVNVHA